MYQHPKHAYLKSIIVEHYIFGEKKYWYILINEIYWNCKGILINVLYIEIYRIYFGEMQLEWSGSGLTYTGSESVLKEQRKMVRTISNLLTFWSIISNVSNAKIACEI